MSTSVFRRAVPLLFTVGLAACGSDTVVTDSASAEVDDFPADASAERYHPMHRAAFGPWYGSGCPDWGKCGCGGAKTLAEEFTCQVDRLTANNIPVTVYLFDGSSWSKTSSVTSDTCSGPDCCNWKLGDQVITRLSQSGIRGLLHFWGGCHNTEQYSRVSGRLGRTLLGFYLDDGSSDEELQGASEFMQSAIPGDWEVVAKAFQNREPSTSDTALSKWANAAYVGDMGNDFAGLREGVERVLAKAAYLPAPYTEFTGYAYLEDQPPAENVYYRRLQFGALQPVMAHTPYGNSDPWRPEYSPDLLPTYRYYAWLHRELVPYFYSYAYRMFETPSQRVLRRGPMTYSLRVGNELYVPIVTEDVEAMDVTLPPGQWIDYWDEARLVSGTQRGFAVPLGREPIFIRRGAIVPMDVRTGETGHGTTGSRGSLTVLVYPSGTSSFLYRSDARNGWITFRSVLSGSALTLTTEPLPPVQSVIYRIGRWNARPTSVAIETARVTVNQGGDAPQLSSEAEVNASKESAWFYDSAARRIVIKAIP